MPLLSVTAQLTVSAGRGGSATRDSVAFVNASLAYDWEVKSAAFSGIIMWYLRLQQDRTGVVAGQILTGTEAFIGSVESGRIDAQGNVTLRLRFDTGAVVTISGQMQRDGFRILGNFTNTTATFNGVPLNGLPVTMDID